MIKNKKGFTLVELIAVITILGVICMIAIPSYNNYIKKAKEKKCEADRLAIIDATKTFINDCISKNNCATNKKISYYVGDELTVSILTGKGYLNSDYAKYSSNSIKIVKNNDVYNVSVLDFYCQGWHKIFVNDM